LVALDGSSDAARALLTAASLASATGGELVVAHVVGLLEEQGVHDIEVDKRLAEVESQVEAWCAGIRDAGCRHVVEVVPGSPVPALLSAARRVGADVIVVGHRGLGGAARLGSTSEGLIREAHVPVLVVPAEL
jgi:nucleotide-binding universal stress UspA family protein